MTKPLLPAIVMMVMASATAFAAGKAPVVVEMFTSKYCPNCPPADHRMKEASNEDKNLLVIMEHVDYWDNGDRKDPDGLAEATQRQYDYSNTIGSRPGEVFTPMPLLDGKVVAKPPLWWSWSDALEKAKADNDKAVLKVARQGNGDVAVTIPQGVATKGHELWLIGGDTVPGSQALVMRGIAQGQLREGRVVTIPKALVPHGATLVALLQVHGPGAVSGVGVTN